MSKASTTLSMRWATRLTMEPTSSSGWACSLRAYARAGAQPGRAVVWDSVRAHPPALVLPRPRPDGLAGQQGIDDRHRDARGRRDSEPERLPDLPARERGALIRPAAPL